MFSKIRKAAMLPRKSWKKKKKKEKKKEIYICSSRLGLIKMDHRHSGIGRNSQQ
jgi:hypothetical protein